MTAEWLAETGLGAATGISTVSTTSTPKASYSNGTLTVTGQFDVLQLYDLSGRVVLTTIGTKHRPKPCLSPLPRGIYTVRMNNGKTETSNKIVIK